MDPSEDEYLLDCPNCGSHSFAVHDTRTEAAFVYCAACGAEVGQLDEFMMIVRTRLGNQRKRGGNNGPTSPP